MTDAPARTLNEFDRYELMAQPEYGFDCYGNQVSPEPGYEIVPHGDVIRKDDKPWDVYAGWVQSDGYHARNKCHARSSGRWTTWEGLL